MSARARAPAATAAAPAELTVGLHDPGMTAMHRAGLAGLAMTLERLDERERPSGTSWSLGATSVTLRADSQEALTALLRFVFERGLCIDDSGLIDFTGLWSDDGPPRAELRLVMQDALRGTFLQHGKSRTAGNGTKTLVLDPDANTLADTYDALGGYVHQAAWEDIAAAHEKGTALELVGWFLPGAVEKHPGTKQTRMQATPGQFLALQFAPVGCISFKVRNTRGSKKQRFALVVPEVDDLPSFVALRRRCSTLRARELTAASAADAALRIALLQDEGVRQARRRAPGRAIFCTVVAFGVQIWAKQQKTRTALLQVAEPEAKTLHNYRLADGLQAFQPRRLPSKDGKSTWVATSAARGAIADALAHGRAWYADLAEGLRTSPDFRNAILQRNERQGLATMVEQAQWDHAREKLFVKACHEAMRRLYGSIGERTREAGHDFGQKAAAELTHVRSALLRAKNADNFRDVLLEFWARASRSKVSPNAVLRAVQTTEDGDAPGWQQILPLLDDRHWRKARDLALLALVSYPGREATPDDEAAEEPPVDAL